ncbi:hypothetical protein MKW94_001889 [Papaver nudicaule]|uniref:PUM-HD domain-containing protein n=1 Tax=Papaver nudicaule TaxID=74823 RepID=A0AA42B3J9_PAPNU|nr:hypothetical protein [Papaver nudicaule]
MAPIYPTISTEEDVPSSLQGLPIEGQIQYGLSSSASNSISRSPSTTGYGFINATMTPIHMNGFGSPFGSSSSGNYSNYGHSTSTPSGYSTSNLPSMGTQGYSTTSTLPIMGRTQGLLENSYVNSYYPQHLHSDLDVSSEPFFSLRMQGWNDYDIRKIVNDDPTLLDEVTSAGIIRMIGNKLSTKYLLKITSNEGETPRLLRLTSSVDAFKALVYIVANEVTSRLGSRAMQNLIKLLKDRPLLVEYVLGVLKPNLLSVMLNQNGSQAVQKILQLCKYSQNKPLEHIYEIAVAYCLELATTEQGVFSLKAVIECIDNPLKSHLLSIICNNALFLSGHPYGNFVVQHALERHPYTAEPISKLIRGDIFKLSMDKYGSRVVERCICSNATDVVVSGLLSDSKQLVELAQDQFGNYVIQKALKQTKGKELAQLLEILRKSMRELENHPNGRNVHNLVKKVSAKSH